MRAGAALRFEFGQRGLVEGTLDQEAVRWVLWKGLRFPVEDAVWTLWDEIRYEAGR